MGVMSFTRFAEKLRGLAGPDFIYAMERGTTKATYLLYELSAQFLTDQIYNIPEDTWASGKKKWTRTGNLRRAERCRVINPFTGLIWNDAGYGTARHNLGLSPGDPEVAPPPPKKKRESTRIAPWRVRAINATAERRLEAYHSELFEVLSRSR